MPSRSRAWSIATCTASARWSSETPAPPDEIGEPVEATNLAESCHDEGTLPEGACAIMLRLGEQYVFYAKP